MENKYRFLVRGDIVFATDEYHPVIENKWLPVKAHGFVIMTSWEGEAYRRLIKELN
jgi:hypothetical protein